MTVRKFSGRRWTRLAGSLMWLTLVTAWSRSSPAADSAANVRLLPPDDLVRIEAPQGSRLLQHPVVQTVLLGVGRTQQGRALLTSPQFDRLRLFAELVQKATGKTWAEGLRELSAGGIAVSFTPGKQGGVTLVAAAADAPTMQRFVQTARDYVQSRQPSGRTAPFRKKQRDGRDYVLLGKAAFAVVDRRLIFCSSEQRLIDALERLGKGSPGGRKSGVRGQGRGVRRKEIGSRNARQTTVNRAQSSNVALLRARVNLAAVRKLPQVARALRIPAEDPARVALLGGWIDLLRRSADVTAEIRDVRGALEIHLRAAPAGNSRTSGLDGFFADGARQSAAPLLQLPGTIYSASWYRDYRSLWTNRRRLLTAKAAQRLEEGDRTLQQQLSVIGARAAASRLFSLLGTHFRVVLARQSRIDYGVAPRSRLPAGALVVDLRDEDAFRTDATPLLRGIGLIAAVGPASIQTRKTRFLDADLTTLRFPDDEVTAAKGNRIRFNFAPTYAITRGHFIAGSTPAIVQDVIKELDRQARQPATTRPPATERQRLSLSNAARALDDFQWELIRALVFGTGFSVEEARGELSVVKAVLERLGEVTTQSGFDRQGFEYRIRIGRGTSTDR